MKKQSQSPWKKFGNSLSAVMQCCVSHSSFKLCKGENSSPWLSPHDLPLIYKLSFKITRDMIKQQIACEYFLFVLFSAVIYGSHGLPSVTYYFLFCSSSQFVCRAATSVTFTCRASLGKTVLPRKLDQSFEKMPQNQIFLSFEWQKPSSCFSNYDYVKVYVRG